MNKDAKLKKMQQLQTHVNNGGQLTEEENKFVKNWIREQNAIKIFTDHQTQAQLSQQMQPLFYDKSGMWWLWNLEEQYWQLVDEIDILNMVKEETGLNTIKSKARTEILNALKQEGRKKIPLPAPKTWIQFKNGITDLNNPGELIEPTPKYFITNPIPWNLGKKTETPNIDKIFEEWVGPEYKQTLYQIIAYALLQDIPIHRIFCLIGIGLNGKSKFQELLRNMIGRHNCTATELDTLLTSRFEITKLHKKLVCMMGETDFEEISKTSLLKKLSGGDLIGFEYKNKTPFEDINYAKIIISTNNLPPTTDKTVGFYRRWLTIPFPNTFNEKKDILQNIPDEEYENLAFKSIELLKSLLEIREFHNEGSIEDRQKKYEEYSDPLEKFIKELTEEDYDGYIWKFEFEKRLNDWCLDNRHRQMSDVTIGQKMKQKGVQQEQRRAEWYTGNVSKMLRAWVGIKWKGNPNEV